VDGASPLSTSSLETVRRIAESVIIAVISSAGLYLVGSVYVDAYYGRLAIEANSLDLPPRTLPCSRFTPCGGCSTTR
jgi:hypothetical protein